MNAFQLYYEDQGQGPPLLFIHGVWMSSQFFKKQLPYFSRHYRVVTPDLRSHGRSSQVHCGHTVANYARDIHALVRSLGLKEMVLIGWSMGVFIIWDYLRQFGAENVKAAVVVDESPSDFKWPDWSLGSIDFPSLCQLMSSIQMDREALVKWLIQEMFKNPPIEEEAKWIFNEITKLPESIASAIFFDQSVQDYRSMLFSVKIPTLLCFGKHDQLVPVEAGEYLQKILPDARLVIFEKSGHCPFLEEPDLFNTVVDQFIQSLGRFPSSLQGNKDGV